MQLIQAPLHTPEQVREILTEATKIADELQDKLGYWEPVFNQACTLLAARASAFVAPQPLAVNGLDLSKR